MAPTPVLKRGRRRINRIAGPGEHGSSVRGTGTNNLLAGSSGNRYLEPEEHQMPVELLLVGPIAQQRTPRLCSICKLPGHDRRTCGRQESGNRHPSQHSTLTGVESEGVEGVESQGVEGLESQGVEVNHTTDDDSGEDNMSRTDDDLDFEGIDDEEVDDSRVRGPVRGRVAAVAEAAFTRPLPGPLRENAALYGAALDNRGPIRGRSGHTRPRTGPTRNYAAPCRAAWL
ncbi:hypothetical protein R1sor_023163 [Riccia sorocarpa]|uniref:Uncharacterized protein n=1 Tax=Riccia sorocarpa TaxID=122646 RepID=A0ABD3GLX0_9MARC